MDVSFLKAKVNVNILGGRRELTDFEHYFLLLVFGEHSSGIFPSFEMNALGIKNFDNERTEF